MDGFRRMILSGGSSKKERKWKNNLEGFREEMLAGRGEGWKMKRRWNVVLTIEKDERWRKSVTIGNRLTGRDADYVG